MNRILPLLLLLLPFASNAQVVFPETATSTYKYLIPLTDEQTVTLLEDGMNTIPLQELAEPIDSVRFPESAKSIHQKYGYYLEVWAQDNQEVRRFVSRKRWHPFVLNNGTELRILIVGVNGETVTEADVRLDGKKLSFEEETNCFVLTKKRARGVLVITRDGHTDYHLITQSRQGWLRALFSWVSPGQGRFWNKLSDNMSSLFFGGNLSRKTRGYLTLNQPKYRPGDTIRFKALLLKPNGKPIDEAVEVRVAQSGLAFRKIADLNPYRPGAYEMKFLIDDSLGFKLDKPVILRLEKSLGKPYKVQNFEYEDYELGESNASFSLDNKSPNVGEPVTISAQMLDANGLNQPGAAVKVTVFNPNVLELSAPQTFIPDIIWTQEQALDPIGLTSITIPAEAFPNVQASYDLRATFSSVDGETIEKNSYLTVQLPWCKIKATQTGDSATITLEGCEQKSKSATVFAVSTEGSVVDSFVTEVPSTFPIRRDVRFYRIKSDAGEETLNVFEPDFRPVLTRTADSLRITIPQQGEREFWYELLEGKKQILSGNAQRLDFTIKAKENKAYYFILHDLNRGQVRSRQFPSIWDPNELMIQPEIPEKIFPGEEVEITLTLKRRSGELVENADLTAYAFTNQFQAGYAPSPPFVRLPIPSRSPSSQFQTYQPLWRQQQHLLSWYWEQRFGLDSLPAYQLLYPENGRQQFEVSSDEEETQLAVFVVQKGNIQPIRSIWMNAYPLYFSGTLRNQPYSFPVVSGLHSLKIRTHSHVIELDSVWVTDSLKTILSIDLDRMSPNTRIQEVKEKLSKAELNEIRPYLMFLNFGFYSGAYMEQGKRMHPITPSYDLYSFRYGGQSQIFGPLLPQSLTFSAPGHFQLTQPFEQNFAYTFSPGLWKMKSRNWSKEELRQVIDTRFGQLYYGRVQEEILTKKTWVHQWSLNELRQKIRFLSDQSYNWSIKPETGRLTVRNAPTFLLGVLVQPGETNSFHIIHPGTTRNIKPGSYQGIFWNEDGNKAVLEEIRLSSGGNTYVNMASLTWKSQDQLQWDAMLDSLATFPIGQTIQSLLQREHIQWIELDSFLTDGPILHSRVIEKDSGEPVEGAAVVVEGTTNGVFTDANGEFVLPAPQLSKLNISYVGYKTTTISLKDGILPAEIALETSEFSVGGSSFRMQVYENQIQVYEKMNSYAAEGDQSSAGYYLDGLQTSGESEYLMLRESYQADEVVVVGRKRSANWFNPVGGIAQDTDGIPDEVDLEPDRDPNPLLGIPSSLRTNFRDYAYWEPALRTDENGQVSFTARFPDDITKWRHQVLAYDMDRRRGASLQRYSLSYLPLMARLSVPRFLVEGDQSVAFGKVQNTTGDSLQIQLSFQQTGGSSDSSQFIMGAAALDTLALTGPHGLDSTTITFQLVESESQFLDGEERSMPVFRRGDRTTEGQFWMMTGDSTINFSFTRPDSVDLTIHASILDVLLEEIEHVKTYPYLCNEQAASKLKVLLMEKRIKEQLGEPFRHDHQVKAMIRRLMKSRNDQNLWGWWKGNETLPWMTLHVLEALFEAEAEGYPIDLDRLAIRTTLEYDLVKEDQSYITELLLLLNRLGSQVNFEEFITAREADTLLSLTERFQLMRLRQDRGLEIQLDSLWTYQLTSVRGQLYWPGYRFSLTRSDLEATILAYQILKRAGGHKDKLERIRAWLLAQRQERGYWSHTYASARILETILPDLMVDGELPENPEVILDRSDMVSSPMFIREFPYKGRFAPKQLRAMTTNSVLPMYASVSQTWFESEPVANDSLFAVTTWLTDASGDSVTSLETGQEISLWIEIDAEKSAEFVQIEVPIPAGCSYAEDQPYRRYGEVHREKRRDRVAIFSRRLAVGTRKFEINLQARYPGSYTLNPGRVEEMYFPVFFGRNGLKTVQIQ